MSENITVEVEGKIMSEIAELTEGEKDSALAHVSEFCRFFSKQMVDCRTDAVGVRVQRQADIAQKGSKKSLHCSYFPMLTIGFCNKTISQADSLLETGPRSRELQPPHHNAYLD